MTDSAKHKKVLSICCSVHSIQDGLSASVYVLLPILAQTFGLNYQQVGLFKGLKSLAQALVEVFSGFLSDRFGERIVLAAGLTLSGAGYLLLSQAEAQNTVLICLVIVGIGGAFHHSPSSKLVTHAFHPSARRGALGLYNSAGDAGKLAFTALMSLATAAAISWQFVAFFYGLITVAGALTVWLVLQRMSQGASSNHFNSTVGDAKQEKPGHGITDRRDYTALLVAVFLDSMVQAGVLTFAAFVMIEKGFSTFGATMATVLVLAGGMFGKAVCGFLAERIGVRLAFTMVQVTTALGLIAVAAAPAWPAYMLLPFIGIVVQGSTSITYSSVNDLVHPSHTARGYAFMYGSSGFASIAGPLGFGLIADHFTIETALLAMAIVSIAAVPFCWLLRTRSLTVKSAA